MIALIGIGATLSCASIDFDGDSFQYLNGDQVIGSVTQVAFGQLSTMLGGFLAGVFVRRAPLRSALASGSVGFALAATFQFGLDTTLKMGTATLYWQAVYFLQIPSALLGGMTVRWFVPNAVTLLLQEPEA